MKYKILNTRSNLKHKKTRTDFRDPAGDPGPWRSSSEAPVSGGLAGFRVNSYSSSVPSSGAKSLFCLTTFYCWSIFLVDPPGRQDLVVPQQYIPLEQGREDETATVEDSAVSINTSIRRNSPEAI